MQLVPPHFRPTLVVASVCLSILWTTVASQTLQPVDSHTTAAPSDADGDQSAYCSRTSDLGLSHRLRREAIKHEILLRLGLDEAPPNPDPSIELPTSDPVFVENYRAAQEVQKAYNDNQKPCTKLNTQEKNLLAFFPSSIIGHPPITHPDFEEQNQKDKDDEKYSGPGTPGVVFNERYRLKFSIDLVDVTSITNVIDDLQAELRLLKLPQFQVIDSRMAQGITEDRVEIRLIERPENYLGQDLLIFITHQDLKVEHGYAVFNVSRAITKWVQRRNSLSGDMELEVIIRHPDAPYGSKFEPGVQFPMDNQSTQLVLTVYNEEHSDTKRAAITATYSTNNPSRCAFQCCWHNLTVNFKRDYNWTWITSPETMEFNYCSGECPQNWAVDGEHLRLLSIHRRNILDDNPTAAPEPCCVPDSYKRQLFVLNIKNDPKMVWVDDAIVKSCVCR